MKQLCVPLILASAFTTWGQRVEIGSTPIPIGSGARAIGQGGAFVAVADDATAPNWNPAGLSQLWRPELSMAFEHISQHSSYQTEYSPFTEHTVQLSDLNYLSAAYPIPGDKAMVASLSYFKQYRFHRDLKSSRVFDAFPFIVEDEIQVENKGSFASLATSLSMDVTPKLSLGASLHIWDHDITGASRVHTRQDTEGVAIAQILLPGAQQVFHGHIDTIQSIDNGYSISLGAMYRVNKQWSLAATFSPEY